MKEGYLEVKVMSDWTRRDARNSSTRQREELSLGDEARRGSLNLGIDIEMHTHKN
jgi:hypothetical protein